MKAIHEKNHNGKNICLYFHGKGSCQDGDSCKYSHDESLALGAKQKQNIVDEFARLRLVRQLRNKNKGKGDGKKGNEGAGAGKGGKKREPSGGPPRDTSQLICRYFKSANGCLKGDQCDRKHEP